MSLYADTQAIVISLSVYLYAQHHLSRPYFLPLIVWPIWLMNTSPICLWVKAKGCSVTLNQFSETKVNVIADLYLSTLFFTQALQKDCLSVRGVL